MTFLYIYLAGYLWFWRYHVGFVLGDLLGTRKPSGGDLCTCLFLGTIMTFFWPATVAFNYVNIAWVKYGTDRTDSITAFFPALKEVETAVEKRERIARESEYQIKARRAEINAHERENGLELTRWDS